MDANLLFVRRMYTWIRLQSPARACTSTQTRSSLSLCQGDFDYMPQFAANLHYLFSELPFLDRFEAAAAAGFKAVEFQVPYDYPTAELSARLHSNALKMVLFDAPMGAWDRGDRGLAAVPGREKEFRDGLAQVIEYGSALGCDTVHLMAGVVGPGEDYKTAERTYISNLRHAASMLAGPRHCGRHRAHQQENGHRAERPELYDPRHARLLPESYRPGAAHSRRGWQSESAPASGLLSHANARRTSRGDHPRAHRAAPARADRRRSRPP